MDAIIKYLDNYLTRTGQSSIGPVEANAVLAKAGLLRDCKDRHGKPLRDLLRDGKLPHAFQSSGKGSAWTIPHSTRQTLKIATTKSTLARIEKRKQVIKGAQVSTIDNSLFHKVLMNEKSFKSAGSIDNLIPHNSGLYCIRISDINKLPNPFNTFMADRQHNIIYIGIAKKSLSRRLLNQELRAKGHGTFFRSIGAMLGHRPPKGSLINKGKTRNYKFSSADEQKIIKWINDNLQVNWIAFSGDFETLEMELISKYRPLINLAKNPSALKDLADLRKICLKIANEQ
jgi:hypothetical protein